MRNASKIARKLRDDRLAKCIGRCEKPNEIKGFREVGGDKPKRVSRPPRYDRFDNPPYILNCFGTARSFPSVPSLPTTVFYHN